MPRTTCRPANNRMRATPDCALLCRVLRRPARLSESVRATAIVPRLFNSLALSSVLCLAAFGCTGKSSAPPLSLQQVQQMSSTNYTHISFEEHGGDVLVSVTDRYGDSHIHKLDFGVVSKRQAIEILKQKQAELEKKQ